MNKLKENSLKPEEIIPRKIVFRTSKYSQRNRCHLVLIKEEKGWRAHYIDGDESVLSYHGETLDSSIRNTICGLNKILKNIKEDY